MEQDTTQIPPPAPPPPPFVTVREPLRRSTTDRHLGGVAGGLARFVGVDPLVLRVAFVLVTIVSAGLALTAYVAAWLLLGDDEQAEAPAVRWFRERGGDTGAIVTLVILVGLAVAAISGLAELVTDGDASSVPFVAGVAFVVYLIATRRRTVSAMPSTVAAPGAGGVAEGDGSLGPRPSDPTMVLPIDPAAKERRRRHRWIRNLTLLVALVVGTTGTALWAMGVGTMPGWLVPAAVLVVLVGGLAACARVGWSWSLSLAAIVTVPILVVALVAGDALTDGVGDRLARPSTLDEIPPTYHLGIGHQQVDLTRLELPTDSPTTVKVVVGIGGAEVVVPHDATVHLTGHVGAGQVTIDGSDVDLEGTDIDVDRTVGGITLPAEADSPEVNVVVDVGVGQVDLVHRW